MARKSQEHALLADLHPKVQVQVRQMQNILGLLVSGPTGIREFKEFNLFPAPSEIQVSKRSLKAITTNMLVTIDHQYEHDLLFTDTSIHFNYEGTLDRTLGNVVLTGYKASFTQHKGHSGQDVSSLYADSSKSPQDATLPNGRLMKELGIAYDLLWEGLATKEITTTGFPALGHNTPHIK